MKIRHLFPVILLTLLILLFLFRGIISDLNSTYFSATGDGLKSYYCAIYHARIDSSVAHFEGMNYPWGESMMFTDGQPPLANCVRFIDQHLFPCADKMVGIFNFMMVFSILLSAIFLFLIFRKYKMPVWYATLIAIGITFLAPQIGRLPGHFSLAWIFWIPLMILLIIEMTEKQKWWKSIVFGVVALVASLMHMYFFLFAVALIGVYWFDKLFIHRTNRKFWIELLHFFIQIILPYLIIHLTMMDNRTDRTMFPYGFYAYRGYPGSVFLPVNKWYVPFLSELHFIRKYSWESLAYVGIIASSGFWVIFFGWMKGLFRKSEKSKSITGSQSLDVVFWASFALLLFSFGLPFILGLDKLRNSIGFLSQLRGVGRFVWLFYFIINIIVWIKLYHYLTRFKKPFLGYGLMAVFIVILGFEAWDYSKNNVAFVNNKVPELNDPRNQLAENEWVNKIDKNEFQAILPLPYFHIGSESTWIEAKCDMAKQMYIVSLKTGLPCSGVMMGRTSLEQTYKNLEFCLTPWEYYRVIEEYPNQKPLLLMVAKCDELNNDEKRLAKNASFLTSSVHFDLYSLTIDSLRAIPGKYNFPALYNTMIDSVEKGADSLLTSVYLDKAIREVRVSRKFQRIMEVPTGADTTQILYLRFWMKNIDHDMVARTQLLIIQSDTTHQTLAEKYSDIFRHIRSINGEWTLVEIPLESKQPNEIIKLLIKNTELSGKMLFFKEFSITTDQLTKLDVMK